MASLFVSELYWYRQVHVEDHARVDTRQGQRDLHITLDLVFLSLKCEGICRRLFAYAASEDLLSSRYMYGLYADIDIGAQDHKGIPYDVSRRHLFKDDLTDKDSSNPDGCMFEILSPISSPFVCKLFFLLVAQHPNVI